MRIETDGLVFGSDDGPLRLHGEPFELLRAITGRRSVTQIRGLHWEGDPSGVLPAFRLLGLSPAASDIHE